MEIPVKETPAFPFRRSSLASNLEFATKRMSVASIAFSTTLLLVMAAPLCAQQPMSLADAALRGQIIFDQSAITGMVLVVVRNREVMIKGYGETFPGSGRTPDSNSQLRLCSISKVFAGDLLTRLSAAG